MSKSQLVGPTGEPVSSGRLELTLGTHREHVVFGYEPDHLSVMPPDDAEKLGLNLIRLAHECRLGAEARKNLAEPAANDVLTGPDGLPDNTK